MRILLSFLLTALLFIQPVSAQQLTPDDMKFGEWMTYYYVKKDVDGVDGYLHWLQDNKLLEKHESALLPVSSFLATLFTINPDKVDGWIKLQSYSGKAKEAVQRALWLSGNSRKIKLLGGDAPAYAKTTPPKLLEFTPSTPADLDMLWAAFSASGDVAYAKRVLLPLDGSKKMTDDPTKDQMIRGAAQWSLGSNMLQHELINRMVRKEAPNASPDGKVLLARIEKKYDESFQRFPDRDGEFSAKLVLVDFNKLENFGRSMPETLDLMKVTKAKVGDKVAAKIIFTGMQLSDDLMPDVTYDIRMLDPDGKVYDGADLKNREGLKSKTPSRAEVYDTAVMDGMHFEDKDKPGKYKVEVQIHDNLGKKNVALSGEVELVK